MKDQDQQGPQYEKYVFDGGTVEHICLSLPTTAKITLGGGSGVGGHDGWILLVKRIGMVDYVRTVPALQKLLGDKFVTMERVI